MNLTWDFYSKRKRITLEAFLEGVSLHSKALDKFDDHGIIPPTDLSEFFDDRKKVEKVKTSTATTTPDKKPVLKKKPAQPKKKAAKNPYFRKVLKKEEK